MKRETKAGLGKKTTLSSGRLYTSEECLKISQEFKTAAELFTKAGSIELASDCLDNSAWEESIAEGLAQGKYFISRVVKE